MAEAELRESERFERRVAEIVVRSVEGFTLVSMPDAPDADLLHESGYHVGLEIVRPVDQDELEARPRISEASIHIGSALASALRGRRVTIYFDRDRMLPQDATRAQFRAWLRETPRRLERFLAQHTEGSADLPVLESHGIERIARVEFDGPLGASPGFGYCVWPRGHDTRVARVLDKKHEKLARYREHHGSKYREYWLAIAGLGPGTLEDGGFSRLLERGYATRYDRLFLIAWVSPRPTAS